MTYENCKKLIEITEQKNAKTENWIADMKKKLEIFLQNNRITKAEHIELHKLLNPANPAGTETPE